MNATHTVDGANGKRKSARVYTHAIVGRYNYDAAAARVREFVVAELTDGHDYYTNIHVTPIGLKYPKNDCSFLVDAEMKKRAADFFIAYGWDLAVAIENEIAARLAKIEESRRLSAEQLPSVLQWSMTERAALAKLGWWTDRYIDVRVLPVVRKEGRAS